MRVQIPAEDTADVLREPQGIQYGQQVEQGSVHRIGEPRFDGYGVVGIGPVGRRWIIQYEYGRQVHRDHFQVLGVTAVVHGAVLAVVAPLQHSLLIVQLVGNGRPINLHAGRKNHQCIPLWNLSSGG